MKYNIRSKIKEHYDLASPYYQKLWGKHIHHGYYITNKETKAKASENLLKIIIKKANIKEKSKILDIGCGVGGTSIYLAKNLNCKVDGISISPIQVEMAKENSKNIKNEPSFFVQDANSLEIKGEYDFIFALEMISHLKNRDNFFKNITKLLKKNGKICIAAWIKDSNLSKSEEKNFIKPIEKGMLVSHEAEPTPERGGRSKRYYRLTAKGEDPERRAQGLGAPDPGEEQAL